MLISHRKKFIYTKTFKTAGTSVELYFEPWCMPEGEWKFNHHRKEFQDDSGIIGFRGKLNKHNKSWYNHMPAQQIRGQIGQGIWDSYFKFCVVRDPFDKLISAFYWKKSQRKRHPLETLIARCTRRLRGQMSPFDQIRGKTDIEQFRNWIAAGGGHSTDRNKYMIDGEVCVDYFIRYEQLADGVRHVCDVLDVPFRPENIPTLKAGVRPVRTIHDYYNKRTVDRVMELYELEIQMFGYRPPC